MEIGLPGQGSWSLLFGVAGHILWSNRNQKVFSPESVKNNDQVLRALFRCKEITQAQRVMKIGRKDSNDQHTILVRWNPPPSGWCKMNVDGAVRNGDQEAKCGGVLREDTGEFLHAFVSKVGRCSVLEAELWAMIKGLEYAWSRRCNRIVLESDSKEAVSLINDSYQSNLHVVGLTSKIKRLMHREWVVRIVHTHREGNQAADFMASLSVPEAEKDWKDTPPEELLKFLREDADGVYFPRTVSV